MEVYLYESQRFISAIEVEEFPILLWFLILLSFFFGS